MRLVEGDRPNFRRPGRISRAIACGRISATGGSRGIRELQEYVRKGGAAARIMLIQAAADEWNVPAAECSAADSVITHRPSGRTVTFGKVAAKAATLEPPKDVTLKDPKDWKIIGKPVKRLDTADKVTGKQVYGADSKFPGMLSAAIKDCPVFGGKIKSFDAAKVETMPGVEEGREGRRLRRRRDRRHLVAGQDRARRAADRRGTRARTPRCRAPPSRSS